MTTTIMHVTAPPKLDEYSQLLVATDGTGRVFVTASDDDGSFHATRADSHTDLVSQVAAAADVQPELDGDRAELRVPAHDVTGTARDIVDSILDGPIDVSADHPEGWGTCRSCEEILSVGQDLCRKC